jgi:PAS domain S-box-containing protein
MVDSISLLHVEDDASFAEMVATYLGRTDTEFDIHHAETAPEGLAILDERDVDCVLSDYDVPGSEGLSFLETVRERHGDLPFVLFTGQGSEDVAAAAISAGASDYLQKFGGTERYDVLARRVESLVEKHRVERRLERAAEAIERTQDGIALFDDCGEFVYLNEAYAAVYDYERTALCDGSWEQLYPEEEVRRYEETVEPELVDSGDWTGEFVGLTRDGERVRATHSLSHLEDGSHVCVIHNGTVERV